MSTMMSSRFVAVGGRVGAAERRGKCMLCVCPPGLALRARGGSGLRPPRAAEGEGAPASGKAQQPWNIGLYHTKRKTFKTGPLGEVPEETYDQVTDPVGWTQEAKMKLAIDCVARELDVSPDFIAQRMSLLQKLVPDLKPKLKTMKVGDLARLVVNVPDIATKLLTLREIFPSANISRMVSYQPALLLEDMEAVREKAEGLRELLQTDDIDRAVELNPTFLELDQVRLALAEVKRLGGSLRVSEENAARYLMMNPSLLFSMQTGDNLIPYDNGSLKQLKASLNGEEGAAPKGW
mmetsp:Transcript_16956/g.34682  ORF Transcript_16956/g.34682 Transcript_16956/m.34682 type:complete len:293 (-) Transcript_16956:59-937(-)|eukprot:CAMPEP_0197488910 /NCGR_PEP_ID=MMETSP1311-20131121/3806_1 /TAXON_ID=464262 /ORGANISM="Genus nov. species nov., Strain RCC856" /LENGTH=292 /DNA_ID=CAMNT_0043033115 /DNA_START=134 /DNA_END=1009 /DNA_ORIENTATION=-